MRIIPDNAPRESCTHTFDSYVQMHHTIEITDDEWNTIFRSWCGDWCDVNKPMTFASYLRELIELAGAK